MRTSPFVVAAFGALLVACAALFEDPVQCKTDGDCARFENGICGAGGTCESKFVGTGSVVPGSTDDGGTTTTPQGTDLLPGDDAAAPVVTCPVLEIRAQMPFPGSTDAGVGEALADATLDCQATYRLRGITVVRSKITIKAGTWIMAEEGSALVIAPGGKLEVAGSNDLPIVFTSASQNPSPQDWVGVVLLGNAPPEGTREGVTFGGAIENDSSGSLKYMRVEYSQRGLEFYSVGSGTVVDNVMVRRSGSNCFTFDGGRVDAKRLACQFPADEMFEFTNGYAGRAQFLVGQRTPLQGGGHDGILVTGSTVTLSNATLCGADAVNPGTGVVLRQNSAPLLQNLVVRGFGAGLDVRNGRGTPFELKSSVFQGNHTENVAYEEGGSTDMASPLFDDDAAFDERAFFLDAARKNSETDPGLNSCFNAAAPSFAPAAPIAGEAPPADGFFEAAAYGGAVGPGADWTKAPWLKWNAN